VTGSLGAPAPRPEPASRRATVRRCRLRRDDVSPRLGPRGRHPAAELRIVPPPTFHPGDINLLSAALVSPGKDPCGLGRCDAARCTTTRGRRRRGPSPPRRIRGSSIGSGVISETSIQRRASLAPAKVIVLMNATRSSAGGCGTDRTPTSRRAVPDRDRPRGQRPQRAWPPMTAPGTSAIGACWRRCTSTRHRTTPGEYRAWLDNFTKDRGSPSPRYHAGSRSKS
jgi:hypothetical protein